MPLGQQTFLSTEISQSYPERLVNILSQDLDFHSQETSYASHDFHSFPAKFPRQLPQKFILELTNPGDVVLDPMMGSGTAVLEAYLNGRRGIGVDIDPLALKIGNVKVTPLDTEFLYKLGNKIIHHAQIALNQKKKELEEALEKKWDSETKKFINKWFAHETQIELLSIINEINKIKETEIRAFFEIAFSAIIITKSGGVTLALDLAHTRPHLAKTVITKTGRIVLSNNYNNISSNRIKLLKKTLRPAIEEFSKRFRQNLQSVLKADSNRMQSQIIFADAQRLPFENASVDLIITSPPYASNAIDYMRAHKFSLVWLGYPIDNLSKKRREYIGGEMLKDVSYEKLPEATKAVVAKVSNLDGKRGRVLHRYYSEMKRTLFEMFWVLRPGKAAIVVVGSSTMRGRDTEIHLCLSDIGRSIGFEVPKIGLRSLDRNKRMLPAGSKINLDSQIQQRMHEEHVIGFYKP
jgi:DNA modification methylase